MKQFFIIAIISLVIGTGVSAQTPYISYEDPTHKGVIILNGLISKYAITNNPAFNWYANSQNSYTPPAVVLNAMEAAKGKVHFIIFGGTWCEDTQFILPKFFKLQELSGFSDDAISLIGVSREKKSLGNLTSVFKITNVPTIIVMKDGKELGRVVEYGKSGQWDKELGELLKL
ncbi:MAG: thioredoxin family protein [Ferruginibacter sp.]